MKTFNQTQRHLLLSVGASLALGSVAQAQIEVGSQVQLSLGAGAQPCNETSIAASTANPMEMIGSWNDYREGSARIGIAITMDGGVSWTDSLLRAPAGFQASTEGDPMTCFDNRTGQLWVGGMSFAGNGGIFVSRKDPGSNVMTPPVMARIAGGVDKGWMAAGRDPGNANQTNVYCAYNEGLITSYDEGATWTAPLSLGPGLGFNPKVGPGGELYIAYWDFGGDMYLRRSLDGGASVSPPIQVATRMDIWGVDSSHVPGGYRVVSLAGLAVNPVNGDLYYVYPDTTSIETNGFNLDIYFCHSTDQGLTWSMPVVINTDSSLPADQFFPWIECDAQGRIHMVFHDTRNSVQNDSDPVGLVDSYYSYSDDGGLNWQELLLTQTPMNSSQAFPGGVFIGDYLGLSTAGHRTVPIYVDTNNGDADIWGNVIVDGPYTDLCMGIGCPCGNNDPTAGCGNSGLDGNASTGAGLSAVGTNVIFNDDLELRVDGMAPATFGLIFASQTSTSQPFGDGRRCLGGMLSRFPARQSNAGGILTYGPGEVVGIHASLGGASPLTAGTAFHYQGWYRDPGGPCGSQFNVSNAITVSWN